MFINTIMAWAMRKEKDYELTASDMADYAKYPNLYFRPDLLKSYRTYRALGRLSYKKYKGKTAQPDYRPNRKSLL